MNYERLTDEFVLRVFGWKLAPDRYIKSGRAWLPKWRFRPFEELSDAFQLLDRASNQYVLVRDKQIFTATVTIGCCTGEASGEPEARTIALAVAFALGLDVDSEHPIHQSPNRRAV